MEFKGIENLKAWKLTPTSPPYMVVCKICHTDFFERNPPHKPNVFTIPTGGNVWESKIKIDETTTDFSCFNCDLDPEYDPGRKNRGDTYKGKGPSLQKFEDNFLLIGMVRTLMVKPKMEKGDQSIDDILDKILLQ